MPPNAAGAALTFEFTIVGAADTMGIGLALVAPAPAPAPPTPAAPAAVPAPAFGAPALEVAGL